MEMRHNVQQAASIRQREQGGRRERRKGREGCAGNRILLTNLLSVLIC